LGSAIKKEGAQTKGRGAQPAPAAPVSPFAAFSVPSRTPSHPVTNSARNSGFDSLHFRSQHSSRLTSYTFTISLRKHVVHNTQRTPQR